MQDDSVLGRFRGGELRRLAVEALEQDERVRFDCDGILLFRSSGQREELRKLADMFESFWSALTFDLIRSRRACHQD